MNLTIWKYPFETCDSFQVKMPAASRILSVQLQSGQPCIWALVAPNKCGGTVRTRDFVIFGTGQEIPDDELEFVATYQQGAFVWHLFEKKP